MKLKANRDSLLKGLNHVLSVVGTKATMPVLSNVLVWACSESNQVLLATTNLDMGIRCEVSGCDVTETGSITLPVKKLANIVKDLPCLDVEIETYSNYTAKITSGTSVFRIMGISRDEFPSLPEFKGEHHVTLGQAELSKMLRNVSYAASTDETRYVMNGVFIQFDLGKLTLAATDGRRLATISTETKFTAPSEVSCILPSKAVSELEKLLGLGESVKVALSDRQAAFWVESDNGGEGNPDTVYVVTKLVEGQYPKYTEVIPKEPGNQITMNRELLAGCIRRAALVSAEKSDSITIHVDTNSINVTASNPTYGDSSVTMAVEYDGPPCVVSFNPQYILESLKAIDCEKVTFGFKESMTPGVFTTQDGLLYVVMPVRRD